MTNTRILSALLGLFAMTSAVLAIEAAPATVATGDQGAADETGLSLDAKVTYVTAYFFRGNNNADDGLILQPEATATYTFKVNDELTIAPWFSVWNNVTDQTYADNYHYWDEVDLTPGVDITYGRFTLSLQYAYYHSPAGNWEDIHELGASVSYDDSEQLGLPIALNPYVGYYQEIVNKNTIEGTYMEVGLKPEWSTEKCPAKLEFPVAVGMGLHGWYANDDGHQETLGYASAAVEATYSITEHFYASAGVKYIRLVADNIVDANDGTENQFIGSVGLGFTF
jgi:hypothetical protein